MQYSKRILVFAIKKGYIHLSFSPEWKSIVIRNKICVLTSDLEIILYVSVRDDEYRSRQWEIFCPLQCIHTQLKNCATTAGNFYAASDVLWSHIADVRSLRITENYRTFFTIRQQRGYSSFCIDLYEFIFSPPWHRVSCCRCCRLQSS